MTFTTIPPTTSRNKKGGIVKKGLKHLLIPKENHVWCRPARPLKPTMDVTIFPSKATCAHCLTNFRRKTTGNNKMFKVIHARDIKDRVGWTCPTCGCPCCVCETF